MNRLFRVYEYAVLLCVLSAAGCQTLSVWSNPDGGVEGVGTLRPMSLAKSRSASEKSLVSMIRQSFKIWNSGDLALVDKLYATEFVRYNVDITDKLVGLPAFKDYVRKLRAEYPDLTIRMGDIFVKDDISVTRWILTGKNDGAMGDAPPTGKSVRVSGVTIDRFFAGKITKEWAYWNHGAVLGQLGYTFVPPAGVSEN